MTHPNFYVLTANSLARLSKEAMTWSDEDCALAGEKIAALVGSVKERVQEVYNYESDEFCVLNHGDAWINNMLFIEDESGRPLQQVFVSINSEGRSVDGFNHFTITFFRWTIKCRAFLHQQSIYSISWA